MLYRRSTALIGILLGVLLVAALSAFDGRSATTVVAAAAASAPAAGAPALAPTTAASVVESLDVGAEPEAAPEVAAPATTLADPKVLPESSGKGRRIVYANKAQRVWVVDGNGEVVRTFRVSGRRWVPNLGEYKVFGKSEKTRNKFFPEITMDHMVRFAISPNKMNNIGFHAIPFRNGVPMQTEAQLGTHRSGGCIRLAPADATWLFNWAAIGTKVVVLA